MKIYIPKKLIEPIKIFGIFHGVEIIFRKVRNFLANKIKLSKERKGIKTAHKVYII